MFNPKAYENSRPDGIGVLEVRDPREPEEPGPLQFSGPPFACGGRRAGGTRAAPRASSHSV